MIYERHPPLDKWSRHGEVIFHRVWWGSVGQYGRGDVMHVYKMVCSIRNHDTNFTQTYDTQSIDIALISVEK